MPRVKRRAFVEVAIDPATEEMQEMARRISAGSPQHEAAADTRARRFMQRLEKRQSRWRAMSDEQRREWAASYVAERSRRAGSVGRPKVADLTLLYAIVTVSEKQNEKVRRRYAEREAARLEARERHQAEVFETPPSERPKPTARPAPQEEPRRRRKSRLVGVVAVQMPDGSRRAPIYDDEDL